MPGKSERDQNSPSGERIAKAMARAGLCSRREAEAWIAAGRVAVNGAVIGSPALNVTPADRIVIDGAPLPQRERTRLFLYHKPRGLVTTHADPQGRPTIFGALPKSLPRLLSVGRLDMNTEGLLLLTNDGGLARTLELPATGWLRRYRVRAHGRVAPETLAALRKGVTVDGIHYGSIDAQIDRQQGANVWITFAMREGKNREVKNVLGHIGLAVNRLIRVSFGPFQLGTLAEGGVEEVKTRHLREQLGERVTAAAGADFSAPILEREEPKQELSHRHPEAAAKRPSKGDGPGRGRSSTDLGSTRDRNKGAMARASARAPQDDGSKGRGASPGDRSKGRHAPQDEAAKPQPPRKRKPRRSDAERFGEPALARREARGRRSSRGKRR